MHAVTVRTLFYRRGTEWSYYCGDKFANDYQVLKSASCGGKPEATRVKKESWDSRPQIQEINLNIILWRERLLFWVEVSLTLANVYCNNIQFIAYSMEKLNVNQAWNPKDWVQKYNHCIIGDDPKWLHSAKLPDSKGLKLKLALTKIIKKKQNKNTRT